MGNGRDSSVGREAGLRRPVPSVKQRSAGDKLRIQTAGLCLGGVYFFVFARAALFFGNGKEGRQRRGVPTRNGKVKHGRAGHCGGPGPVLFVALLAGAAARTRSNATFSLAR